jgi:GlpG protein
VRDVAEEQLAVSLSDALGDHGIESQVRPSERGFMVWVVDEQVLGEATQLVTRWLDQGDAPSFEEAAQRGRNDRELRARLLERRTRKATLAMRRAQALARLRPPVLTWGLIALTIFVALLTDLGQKRDAVSALLLSDPRALPARDLGLLGHHFELLALPFSEPFRFITQLFVQFDPLELLFELIMLRELGRVIEGVHGARKFAALVALFALVSCVAQYEIGRSPEFSGMSGVVFGLLGLVWVRGRFDLRTRYALTRGTVQFMVLWLCLGFISAFKIALWCPLFGLLTGATCALCMALARPRARTP